MTDPDADVVLSRRLSGLGGLWWYLVTRIKLRARLEIERERNRAYAEHRDRISDNTELLDYEDGQGRRLWIRKNGTLPDPVGPGFPADSRQLKPRYIAIVEFSCSDKAGTTGEL